MASVQLGGLSVNNPLALSNTVAQPSHNGYFWKGADGKVYVQGSQGINAAGSWDGNSANYWASRGYTHTPDSPTASTSGGGNTGGGSNTASNTGGGGGGGGGGYGSGSQNVSYGSSSIAAPVYPDKSNDITLQNAGLGAVGATENAGIKAIDDAWNKINGQYEGDLATAGTEYGHQTTSNNQDLQTNKQTALERGVSGRQGLFGTLASIGALNGTGIERANHAVQQGTNEDLTTASNTYATNQNSLDSGYNAYTQQEKRLQDAAKSAHDNNQQQVHNDAAKSRQQYLTNLANDYQTEGKTAEAKTYAQQAADLFPSIAATNVPTINMGYSGGAYTAPTLGQYVAKANNTSVQSTPGNNASGNNVFNIPGLEALNKKQTA